MSEASQTSSRNIYDLLRERCASIGMLLWHCDPAGKVLVQAAPLEAGALVPSIDQHAALICAAPKPVALEIAPGEWLVPVEDKQASRRQAVNIALVSSTDPNQVRRAEMILHWSYSEFARTERDNRTIEQFSEKLAQAYEETNLLYRMARLLNCASDPAQAVFTIASQLQEVLPFGWLAIRFGRFAGGVRDLSGKTIVAGTLPVPQAQIESLSDPLLDRMSEQGWVKLLDPRKDPLAAATGAEVLAEPITHDRKVIGVLMAGGKSGPDPELSSFEIQFLDATADFLGVFHENLSRFAEQTQMFLGTVSAMTAAIDAKDRYTCGHSERVGLLASKMAEALGLDKQLIEQYRIGGLVHDVGKIGVPEAVLTKPGRLTEEEFAQIKTHPGIGYNILRGIGSLEPVLPGVLSHHERWDGRGYPNGIAGEQIPIIARVLALADTFDAMSSNRSYRPALPRQRVLDEISRCSGSQFDPSLAPIFIGLDFADFDAALESHKVRDQSIAA